jgi:hypothetical protein
MSSLGFSKTRLMQQSLIAPSCGTGSLSLQLAEKVLSMTSLLSEKIRDRQRNYLTD